MTSSRRRRLAIGIAIAVVLAMEIPVWLGLVWPREIGPLPEGEVVVDGVVMWFDAADGADTVVAEVRSRRKFPGEVRDALWLVRAPFGVASSYERLGKGAVLGQVSPDGRWISWLASKERGDRTGPGKLRGVAPDAPVVEQRAMLPPAVFDGDRALVLTGYQSSAGRGSLAELDLARGTSRVLATNVPPQGFAPLSGGRTFLLRRNWTASTAEALVVGPGDGAAPPIAAEIGLDGAFRVSPDGRVVTLRHAAGTSGARPLVRWTDGALERLTEDAAAWTVDAGGRAWWASAADGTVRVFREGAALGTVPGRRPMSVHPLPGGEGAWLALADRPCGGAPLPRSASGCLRLALVGVGAPPPELSGLRRVIAPAHGWPVVLLGPVEGAPAFVAAADPANPVTVADGGAHGVDLSTSGRWVAGRVAADGGGHRIVLADLQTGAVRTLAERAPESLLSFHGEVLLYVWRNRAWRGDPRNGLYRVVPP